MTTDTLEALREAREALERQTENMAFVLNRVDLPEAWSANFNNELALSRTTLSRIDAALAEEEGKPVAWRWRFVTSTDGKEWSEWHYVDTLDGGEYKQRPGEVVQPLYASPDHIGNSTTMVPALGVEGVCENRLMAALQEADAEFGGGLSGFRYRSLARAIIAAMEKSDGATLGVAQIKATIWKHWRNQNGQTLEDRFTSAAEEIAAMEKNYG